MLLRTIRVSVFILLIVSSVFAQDASGGDSFLSGMLLPAGLLLLAGVAVLVYLWVRSAKSNGESLGLAEPDGKRPPAEIAKPKNLRPKASSPVIAQPERARAERRSNQAATTRTAAVDIRDLPISRIESVDRPPEFEPLAESDDEDLLTAIDEVLDDSEAESELRLTGLRVVGGFRSRNSVEALSQIALYDLSANMRSKAIMILADIDHESVFETIVLACADPSREVRAASARALVKVTFDRADAWARFAFADDRYLGTQMARAAVESGIAERSFERLVMRDEKAAYEAFTLVYLLIRSGEIEKIFEAVQNHRDLKVRLALLHSMKAANVAEVIPHLSAFIAAEPMSSEIADKAREALLGINAAPVTV